MKSIAQFFTIFWVIYFPTCIAYNDLPGFSSIDEVMTGIIVLYTFYQKGKRYVNNTPWNEYFFFIGLLIFYTIYSLIMHVNVTIAVWYDLMQQVRPWSVIYCTWILNPRFTRKQKKWMLGTMVVTLISFVLYHPEMTNQVEGAEYRNAPFGQLAICTSMAWFLFTKKCRKNLWITTAIAIVGLMGMKFKYYGQFGAWMFMLYYINRKFSFKSTKIIWQLAFLLFVVVILGWDRFDTYYIQGATDENLARPMINKATWRMLWDYFPLGTGFGAFGTAASAVYYSPLWEEYGLSEVWGLLNYNGSIGFHCDSFFASFAQIGWVGVVFFLIFWKRRLQEFNTITDIRYYKVALMAFFCVFIEWFGDQSFFSGKGMGYMMLMGLCLNRIETRKLKKEKQIEIEAETGHGETTNIRT